MNPLPSIKRELASLVLKSLFIIVTIVAIIGASTFLFSSLSTISDGSCNIAVYPIKGVISPYSLDIFAGMGFVSPDDVREFVSVAEGENLFIKGIMFDVDSPGGTPVASEQLMDIIENTSLPTVALIGDMGASGGYMAALGADTIIASPFSSVGSIGVTMSYLEYSKQNEEDGITYVDLNSAPLKDAGSPDKAITDEERARFQSDLDELHTIFVDLVAQKRELPREEVAALADGSTYNGTKALEHKLIDRLGGRSVAREVFAEQLGLSPDEIIFCEYTPVIPFM